ncbi:MAG: ROK family protein [Albidovulum sp.]
MQALDQDQGARNRNRVIAEILRNAGLSRTDIGNAVGLNAASVSRITRDMIDAALIRETDPFAPKGRPGRRFVGLEMNGEGGYVIGIGLNAFRQSVTLADLENRKIAEWVSSEAPGEDGAAFLGACLERAGDMLRDHVADRSRFFGVGIAIAAELDGDRTHILRAPVFGWSESIPIRQMVRDILDAPSAIDAPASAINKAEGDFGLGKGIHNLTTLYCSLGFGIGVRQVDPESGSMREFGRVLTEATAPDGSGRALSLACGGLSFLTEVRPDSDIAAISAADLSASLVQDIAKAKNDATIQSLLFDCGARAAERFSITLELCQPDCLLLAGPMAGSPDYMRGFKSALRRVLGHTGGALEVLSSNMTPTGASRWLALRENVAAGSLNLASLKQVRVA